MEEIHSTVTSNISSTPGFIPSSPSMDSRGVLPSVVLSLCFLVGLPGNIAVIILKPNFQHLSSMSQSLMVNLAVSDMLCLLTLPLWIYSLLYGWIYGQLACKILAYVMYCCIYGSLLTIVLLSFQRYMLLVHQKSWDQKKMRLLLVLLWLVGMILSIPALVVRQLIPDQQWVNCGQQFSSRNQEIAVLLAEALVGFASLPIVGFSYIQLYRKVNHTRFFNNPQTSRLVTSIIIVFFVLWIPNHTVDVLCVAAIALHNERLEQTCKDTQDIVKSLTFFNSCLNPLLYAFNSQICKCVRRVNLRDNVSPHQGAVETTTISYIPHRDA